jgi:acetoacetate decarboxylase
MNDVDWLGAYGESNVSIGCRLPGTDVAGSYSPYLFLSSDVGVAHGREVHGQPKKFGEPLVEIRGDLTVGIVRRNGIDVLTGTLPTRQRADSLDSLTRHFDFALNINLKAIDQIDGRPAIRQLTARHLADVRVHECWGGPCTVELRPNAQAPIHRLPVVDMLDGLYWRADFTLVPGRIIHDYLDAKT